LRVFLPSVCRLHLSRVEQALHEANRGPLRVEAAYSVKTNPDLRIQAAARDHGLLAEAINQLEVEQAVRAGFAVREIVLNLRCSCVPAPMPFPVLHVDTGLNFPEVLEFRDRVVAEQGLELLVASVPDAIRRGVAREEPNSSRNRIQTLVLLEATEQHGFDALVGGARRDEEKSRATGTDLLVPRRVRPVGPEGPASRGVEPVQGPHHSAHRRTVVICRTVSRHAVDPHWRQVRRHPHLDGCVLHRRGPSHCHRVEFWCAP
jgi:hypothetical protein